MRLYAIVLFLFLFNLFAGTVIELNLFDQNPIQPDSELVDLFDQNSDSGLDGTLNQPPIRPPGGTDNNFGDFLRGMGIFVTAFTYATVDVGSLMNMIFVGVPEIANLMTIIVYFIYAAGIVQLVFNRSFRVQR